MTITAEAARASIDDRPVHASTFALWAAALDEGWAVSRSDSYPTHRERPPQLDGLRVVRNALMHGMVTTVSVAGLVYPLQYPEGYEVRWIAYEDIDRWPRQKAPTLVQRESYERDLACRNVMDVMEPVRFWFESLI